MRKRVSMKLRCMKKKLLIKIYKNRKCIFYNFLKNYLVLHRVMHKPIKNYLSIMNLIVILLLISCYVYLSKHNIYRQVSLIFYALTFFNYKLSNCIYNNTYKHIWN